MVDITSSISQLTLDLTDKNWDFCVLVTKMRNGTTIIFKIILYIINTNK